MVLEEKLNNEKTNGSEYLKLDIPSEYLAAPGQSEGIGHRYRSRRGGGGGAEQGSLTDSAWPWLLFFCQRLKAFLTTF